MKRGKISSWFKPKSPPSQSTPENPASKSSTSEPQQDSSFKKRSGDQLQEPIPKRAASKTSFRPEFDIAESLELHQVSPLSMMM